MYRDLLNEMIKLIEENHLDAHFNIKKEELNNYIEEVLNRYELKDEYDFYYVGNVIIKKMFDIYDSHTKLLFKDSINLPIRLKYIDNRLYIIRTDKNNEDLLYSEVLKINNIEVTKLIEEIKNMIPYSTEGYLMMYIEVILRTINKLKSLPSINNNCYEFEYELLKENQIIKRKLKEEKEDLLHINYMVDNYYYELMDDKIYIVYNACKEDYEGQMKEFVNNISKCAADNHINKFIVDIRGNAGGNSNIFNSLVDYLKGKEIITLIDEYVFSGGRWCIFDLKNIGSKFIGTGIGTSMNCFGNLEKYDIGGLTLSIANKYWYFDKDCIKDNFKFSIRTKEVSESTLKDKYFMPFEEMKKHKEYFIPQIFEPDCYVHKTIEDYKNGTDSCLEKAIELFDEKVK